MKTLTLNINNTLCMYSSAHLRHLCWNELNNDEDEPNKDTIGSYGSRSKMGKHHS